jgi:formylglycine-generating enzyme required for sulfatase activity
MPSDAAGRQVEGQSKLKVFISYSRKDMAFADRLEAALNTRGFEPLIDRAEIFAFEDWWKRIKALIGRADTVVFVLSPDSVASDIALKEVLQAASFNKRFAPIVYRRVDDKTVPEALRRLNFIFFDDPTRFEASADQLAEALRTDIDWIRQHTELGEAARRWVAAGRPSGLLLRSPALEAAEHWIDSQPAGAPPPTGESLAFVIASRRDASRRRLRARAGVLGVFAVAIVSALAWRYQQLLGRYIYWYSHVRGHVLDAAQETALRTRAEFKECTDCPIMIIVPAGTFMMGSPDGSDTYEPPQHQVEIAKAFAVAKFALTFDEWDPCVAQNGCVAVRNDSNWGRGSRPVINVSWEDAQQYVFWIRNLTGKPYRLLSEAEFEYAARSGTQTNYPWGDDIGQGNANCKSCGSQWDNKQTAPVGSFPPNAFGLYDMHGNAWEWVQDCFQFSYDEGPVDGSASTAGECDNRVNRGGAWVNAPQSLRSAHRNGSRPVSRANYLGFRVARSLTR